MAKRRPTVNVHVEADANGRVVVNVSSKPKSRRREFRATSIAQPPANGTVRVRVDQATGLGYICARGSETEFTTGDRIRAMVYPGSLTEAQIDQSPPVSARTADVDSSFNWSFEGGNDKELPGCAHGIAGLEPSNTLGIWHVDSGNAVIERSVRVFRGLRSTQTECEGGSGSNSSSSEVIPVSELARIPTLVIHICDGKLKGEHLAHRVAAMVWKATIKGKEIIIFADPAGKVFAMAGAASGVSEKVDQNPFSAVFSGAALLSNSDVVVTAK